jgi:hypothetical protein
LLSENSYGMYILYASGEIALVIVGILLALQLDSWHQNSVDHKSEKYFLNQIKIELASDTLVLHQQKIRFENSLPIIELFVEELHKPDNRDSFNRSLRAYLDGVWAPLFLPVNNSTYEEMKSSNKLGIIRDRILRNDIVEIYNQLSQVQMVFTANSNFLSPMDRKLSFDHALARYLKVQAPMFGSYITEEELYQYKNISLELESNAANWHWTIMELIPLINTQLEKLRQLMREIEGYLSKNQ